jgi:hypothetical protein
VLRVVIAPFTSVSFDVVQWVVVVRHAMVGTGMYVQPGFSYPPVWGYLLEVDGVAARALQISPGSVGVTTTAWTNLGLQTGRFGAIVTQPLVTLVLKLPLIASDVVVAWIVWHLALRLGSTDRAARLAAAAWFLCPIVIWASAVHGAFDTLVALAIAAAVLARLQGRFVWAGAAVSLGLLTKVTPVFMIPLILASCLWPIAGERLVGRWRAVAATAAGAVGAAVILVVPVLASGQGSAAYVDLTARAAVQPSIGALSLFGFSSLHSASWVASWASTQHSWFLPAIEFADVGVALVVAGVWWRWRPRGADTFVILAAMLLMAVVLIGPIGQPQYLVWFAPLLAALAARFRGFTVALGVLGTAGVLFELSLLGPLAFLGPLSQAVGIPSPSAITAQLQRVVTAQVYGQPLVPTLMFFCWVLATVGFIVAFASCAARRPRSCPDDPVAGQARSPEATRMQATSSPVDDGQDAVLGHARPAGVGVTGNPPIGWVIGIIVIGFAVLGGIGGLGVAAVPAARLLTQYHPGIGHTPATVTWHLTDAPPDGLAVSVLATPAPVPLDRVVVYSDINYPSSGSSPYAVQGVANHLPADLRAMGDRTPVLVVNAEGLRRVLTDRAAARGTVVVATSGTLPNVVWSSNIDDVSPFITAGGVLAWGGAFPGYYSVGQSPSMAAGPTDVSTPPIGCNPAIVKGQPHAALAPSVEVLGLAGINRLLGGSGLITASRGWICIGSHATSVAVSLGLASSWLHAAPRAVRLQLIGGEQLGFNLGDRSSISWMPRGKGGILLFGGLVDGPNLAADTARLLAVAGAHPTPSVLVTRSRSSIGSVAVPAASAKGVRVSVVAQGAGATTFVLATRTIPGPNGTLTASTPPITSTTCANTTPVRSPSAVTVSLYNGSGLAGAARTRVGPRLAALGYTIGTIANAPHGLTSVKTSRIEFVKRAGIAAACSVARGLGLSTARVGPLTLVPVAQADAANVVVLVGKDVAGG